MFKCQVEEYNGFGVPLGKCNKPAFSFGKSKKLDRDVIHCCPEHGGEKEGSIYKDKTIVIEKDEGSYWCAHFDDFINIQESVCGFGESPIEALSKLLLEVGK